MKRLILSVNSIYNRIRITKKVNSLNILESFVDDDKAYIKLENGLQFWGLKSRKKEYKYYKNLISNKLKKILPFECYNLALNIIIRYHEGGLKFGGPAKELYYKVKEGDTIAEMGAYLGHYTMYLSGKAGKSGKVIAIEPMPENLNFLNKNIKQNSFDNVHIIPKGVWDKTDELEIFQEKDDHQSASLVMKDESKNKIKVPVDSLDNILNPIVKDKIDFMIIQLNGVELKALQGLEKYKPKNIAIAARYDNIQKDIVKLLDQRSYKTIVESGKYIFAELIENE